MNKKTGFPVWLILLSSMMVFMLNSCTTAQPTITPTQKLSTLIPSITPIPQTSTPLPPYFHFTPPENSNIHLEFDYPSSWFFSVDTQYTDFMIISLADPRFSTVPTQSPNESHGTPSDFGGVNIWITLSKPGQTPISELESQKQICIETHWMKVLGDYTTIIDGFDASVLECLVSDPETSPSSMLYRRTYFMVNNQAYEIFYSVAEKERGGEFEQGYEYFFNSLKIVP